MSQTVLSIRNLVKVYPGGVRALNGVSFDVKRGEFVAIIGLSGSGKSTLLRCINRLHDPTSGEVLLHGTLGGAAPVDIAQLPKNRILELRRRVAMVFQQFNIIPRHSVIDNVLYGALGRTPAWRSLLGLYAAADRERARECLRTVGIEEKARYRAGNLSGGQQQRVAIARSLMQSPEILLADEPVASLDPATCHTIMDQLRKMNRELGLTVICNLHFLSLVREYADRVIALKGGEKVFEGPAAGIDDAWFERIYGEGTKEVHIE